MYIYIFFPFGHYKLIVILSSLQDLEKEKENRKPQKRKPDNKSKKVRKDIHLWIIMLFTLN